MKKIIIFAKSPVLGGVKTRLESGTPLSKQEILILYTAFLKDVITTSVNTMADRIYIAYYPESSVKLMEKVVKSAGYSSELQTGRILLFPQTGSDFDTRLTRALYDVKRDNDPVIIIGSDSPTLGAQVINKAFSCLRREGIVLGPSGEGGVYLIGLRTKNRFLFEGMFREGLEIENLVNSAKENRLPLYVLHEVTDVDVLADLQTLIGNLTALEYSSGFNRDNFLPVHTFNVVKKLGLSTVRMGVGTRKKRLARIFHSVS